MGKREREKMLRSRLFWATGIVGVLLVIAPWVLGYSTDMVAFWSSLILGALIVILSVIKGLVHDRSGWEYWVIGILGILSAIAPFVLAYAQARRAELSDVVLGIVALLLAAIAVLSRQQMATSQSRQQQAR